MSKFFTYEDRLNLQKKLKESMSIKAIAGDLGKNPTTVSREIKKYSSEVATGHPGYPFNECKNRFNCRNKIYVVKIVLAKRPNTVSCARTAMSIVRSLFVKSVQHDSDHLMSVMAAKRLVNAVCLRLFMMQNMLISKLTM